MNVFSMSQSLRCVLLLFLTIITLGGCSALGEGLNDLSQFCNAVDAKCSSMNASECVDRLGADTTTLKSPPDYKAAKVCVDQLSTCTTPPMECWKHAVQSFK